MNDIVKENITKRLEDALKKEELSNVAAGEILGINPNYLSLIKNPQQWHGCPLAAWESVLTWINSGQTLKEYSEKHGKVLPVPKIQKSKEVITPSDDGCVKSKKIPIKKDAPRLNNEAFIDLLLKEKELLKCRVENIDTLLKLYIS